MYIEKGNSLKTMEKCISQDSEQQTSDSLRSK